MPSLTECINRLKAELQTIANQPMTQNYDGLGDLVFSNDDTVQAKEFADSLQNNMTSRDVHLNSSYSMKALQSAWNIADTLSIVVKYAPCEWSAGFFRGLTASGTNGKFNAENLLISMVYMNMETSVVPYIVDDVTYRINRAFLNFTHEVQATYNGKSILGLLERLSSQYLGERIAIDEQVIKTAEARIQAYEHYLSSTPMSERYKSKLVSYTSPEIDEEDGETYYDARTGEEEELRAEITASTLGFLAESLLQVHEHRDDLGDEYNNTRELFLGISDVLLDPHASVESVTDCILDNKPLDSFLKKEQSKKWVQYIGAAYDYLKQKIHQLLDICRFKKSTLPHN